MTNPGSSANRNRREVESRCQTRKGVGPLGQPPLLCGADGRTRTAIRLPMRVEVLRSVRIDLKLSRQIQPPPEIAAKFALGTIQEKARIQSDSSLFLCGADGRTRTGTAFATAPSRQRVYQFHHVGKFLTGRNLFSRRRLLGLGFRFEWRGSNLIDIRRSVLGLRQLRNDIFGCSGFR